MNGARAFLAAGSVLLLFALPASARIITVADTTDQSIQNAVGQASSGDTLFLPAGSYFFDQGVIVNKARLTFLGAADLIDVGVVEPGAPNTPPVWSGAPSRCYAVNPELTLFDVAADDAAFEKLKIEGNVTHETGYGNGIRIDSHDGLAVRSCEVLRHCKGVAFENSRRGVVRGSYVHENYRDGFGYGVCITGATMTSGGSEAIVERSEFTLCRHDIASNSPRTRFLVRNCYFHDFDLLRRQPSIDGHGQAGESLRIVVRDNVFENTRPVGVKTGSLEITGNYFDPACGTQAPYGVILFGPPVVNDTTLIPQARQHDIYIGHNRNASAAPLVEVYPYNYPPVKWTAYNLFPDGALWEDQHHQYPPLDTDPRPLTGFMHATLPGDSVRVPAIEKNAWYDLHVWACDPQGAGDIEEIGIQIADTTRYDHVPLIPDSGRFQPGGDYFIRGDSIRVYARETAGSGQWTDRTGQLGAYVDARTSGGRYLWRPAGSHRVHLILRFKVLDQALAGDGWAIYGYVRDHSGRVPVKFWLDRLEGWPLSVSEAAGVEGPRDPAGDRGLTVRCVPNPFRCFTTLPGRENERFVVYDCQGRYAGSGPGSRLGADLVPGIYFALPVDGRGRASRIVKAR